MSQKCKHCGYEASDEEKYCPKCRNALDLAYQSETTQNAEKDLFALSKKALHNMCAARSYCGSLFSGTAFLIFSFCPVAMGSLFYCRHYLFMEICKGGSKKIFCFSPSTVFIFRYCDTDCMDSFTDLSDGHIGIILNKK